MKCCETCKYRDNGYCISTKISEDFGQQKEEAEDMLIYSYSEGGSFQVGPKFGCVHHEKR